MFSAVLAILLGGAAITLSAFLAGWFVLFWVILAVLIPLAEEPKLARRFGTDYDLFRRDVPRWLPRLRPWSLPHRPDGDHPDLHAP